jgi:ubiquitin C-terminal hydrolase
MIFSSTEKSTFQVLLYCTVFLVGTLLMDPTKLPVTTVENNVSICQTTNAVRSILAQMVIEGSRLPDSTPARIVINTQPVQSALKSRFSGGTTQEDAEEFLTYLLNEVSGCGDLGAATLQQPGASWSNPATFMRGSSVQICQCTNCNRSSDSVETPFFMLHISLPEATAQDHREAISELVLNEFTRAAPLDGDNLYNCSSCKAFHVGHKYNSIKTPPEILGVHLKRFSFDERTGRAEKIMTTVDIDNRITLHCSGGEAANYFLFSVVMHEGLGSKSGHYFSICRCSGCAASEAVCNSSSSYADRTEWRILDDGCVSEKTTLSDCMAQTMVKYPDSTPYIVFYAGSSSASPQPCPVCCDNGSRIMELARRVPPLPSTNQLPLRQGPAENNTANAPDSDPSCRELIQQFLQGRSFVRLIQVWSH